MIARLFNFFNWQWQKLLLKLLLAQTSRHFLVLKLFVLWLKLKTTFNHPTVGSLWGKSSLLNTLAALLGLRYNLNHLGNPYSSSVERLSFSQLLEKNSVEKIKKLLSAPSTIEGYVTSGGTESNLLFLWMGREWAQKKNQLPLLFLTPFAHYSLRKAARISQVLTQNLAVTEPELVMDCSDLEERIRKELKKDQCYFLVPITIGYSSTGGCDPLVRILSLLSHLEKTTQARFFVWIDAAMHGLPLIFSQPSFKPFKSRMVQGYFVDFHKLGQTPIPTGMVLYRKKLRNLIETNIEYLEEKDATISGSRPGFSALSIWSQLERFSTREWQFFFQSLYNQKQLLINVLKKKWPLIKIVTHAQTLTLAIGLTSHFLRLPKKIEERYALTVAKISYHTEFGYSPKQFKHYKIHITNIRWINAFINDLQRLPKNY